MSFLENAVSHYRSTLSILFLIVIAGLVARSSMTTEANPDVSVPLIMVQVFHDGISPQDGARMIVKPLEKELRALDDIDQVTATTRESIASVAVMFEADADLDKAMEDVRAAVTRARAELPQESEEPVIMELSADGDLTLIVTVGGENVGERVIYDVARDLRRKIDSLALVLSAELVGHREEVAEAVIDPVRLEQYGITSDELSRAIATNNRLVPAGELEAGQGRFSVKVPGLIETAEDLYSLPIKSTTSGTVVLGDVAEVRRTFKDPAGFNSVNGEPGIAIQISKRTEANDIEMVNAVRALVESERPRFPHGVEVGYTADMSEFTLSMVSEMQGNILTAMLLVMIIVVAALGLRSGIIVGFGIPFSLLFALVVTYAIGFSFNMMVMFGMLLALGMLIDGAIVIAEFADRKMAEGMSAEQAYGSAVKRMFWPVAASTATTLAAFLPIMFWPGVAGEFMRYLPVTVFAVLTGSLLYALLFGPVVGSVLPGFIAALRRLFRMPQAVAAKDQTSKQYLKDLETCDIDSLRGFTGLYARSLRTLTNRVGRTAVGAVLLLFGIFYLYGSFNAGVDFFGDSEPKYATVKIRAQGNLSVQESRELVQEVEQIILDVPGVLVTTASSSSGGIFGGSDSAKDQIGQIVVELADAEDLESGTALSVIYEIRDRTINIPGIKVGVDIPEGGPPVGRPVNVQLESHNRDKLIAEARRLQAHMENNIPGLVDVVDSSPLPGITWEMEVNRTLAAQMGANVTEVGRAVQLVTNGIKLGEYRPDDAEDPVDIRVRFAEQHRGIKALDQLRINTSGGPVPISTFVQRVPRPSVDKIDRVDGIEVMTVKAGLAQGVLATDMVREIQAYLDENPVDPEVNVVFRGSNEEQQDSQAFLAVALLLSLFLMFILLVTQFNSFYQSLLILSAVIMSTAGVLLGLLISQSPFSTILTGTGIVALAGIVVNNNIILIDTYNVIRRERPDVEPPVAAVMASVQRLRPVFLTTFTTILGLLPMALGLSVDFLGRSVAHGGPIATQWVPLASAIVYGLSFSTLLTLLLTPVLLLLPRRIKQVLFRRSQRSEAQLVAGSNQ
ncbi:efflux RND transporter permease subunit [Gilvimarinus sp. F26214L]|uniref:efflux RND transporter permease subunit n=1 Tax=Gilvimarinus sp. DZF01 TaxID=3461371 RepID=UPI0040463D24